MEDVSCLPILTPSRFGVAGIVGSVKRYSDQPHQKSSMIATALSMK
jgi:hypothetical protein